jgi:LuxR family transcriptional regulator, maltose regulon positive regulatory protein
VKPRRPSRRLIVSEPGKAHELRGKQQLQDYELGEGGLSNRQLQILELYALGDSDQEIADKLGIMLETVKSHGKTIRAELNARTRAQAVYKGVLRGVLPIQERM